MGLIGPQGLIEPQGLIGPLQGPIASQGTLGSGLVVLCMSLATRGTCFFSLASLFADLGIALLIPEVW